MDDTTAQETLINVKQLKQIYQDLSITYKAYKTLEYLVFSGYELNGTLVRDFVPVERIFDGSLGLYDRVNSKLYLNSADSGNFSKGPETGYI